MTVPLDNLYDYINGLIPEPIRMYLFYPHGSRNILNAITLDQTAQSAATQATTPIVVCYDQEPLNVSLYQDFDEHDKQSILDTKYSPNTHCLDQKIINYHSNLKIILPLSVFDQAVLLHSEKNSKDLEWYENNGWVGAHYWSHAIIAKDWYRFAQHDLRLINKHIVPDKNFLIYCRDCTGSRQYRLKFQELLSLYQLTHSSITSVNKNSIGLLQQFDNPELAPATFDFVSALPSNHCLPSESANYCVEDFVNTKISVVLETVFDTEKIHLTEKILRPIACGHPFILAAGPGSLQYLKSYGFRTFAPYIDESYDSETNSLARLKKIVAAMQAFDALPPTESAEIYKKLKSIAEYNKKWFFSSGFDQLVQTELTNNINSALAKVKKSQAKTFFSLPIPAKKLLVPDYDSRKTIIKKIQELRKINRA